MDRLGAERLLEMVLARTPERVLDALVAPSPEDGRDLLEVRETLGRLGAIGPRRGPSPDLRARLLARASRARRPSRPVVLVVDMLVDHLAPGGPLEVPRARAIVPALAARLEAARRARVPVVFACDAHAADDPDFREWPAHAVVGTPGAAVWPALAPQAGDHVVPKRTYSAFVGSELGALLDRLGADSLILTGCATEIGLAATATDALQRGFAVSVPPDCQAGGSELAERVTLATLATLAPFEPRWRRAGAVTNAP